MGTAIRAAIEYLAFPERPDPWRTLTHHLSLCRYYDLFGLMGYAGYEHMYPPRGIPTDADDDTCIMLEESNNINASWLTTQEFRAALKAVNEELPDWWAALAAMEELERRGLPTRLVFAFD